MKKFLLSTLVICSSFAHAAGNVEAMTTPYHINVTGWACDPAYPNASIDVEVWRDNVFIGALQANQPREPAVAAACGSTHGSHGFSGTVKMPVYMLTGGNHQVHIFGRRVGEPVGSVFELSSSPQAKAFASDSGSSQSTFLFQQGLNPLFDIQAARWDSSWGMNNIPPLTLFTLALGDVSSTPAWSVASKTGLAAANGALAVLPNAESSAIQVKGDQVGIFIHSATAPVIQGEPKKVLNFLKRWPIDAPHPWGNAYGENASLCTGFNAAVPVSTHGPGANNFASTAFYLWDLDEGGEKPFFVYEIAYYYSGGYDREWVRFDGGLGVGAPHALTYAGSNTVWSTTSDNSNYLQANTWGDDRYFSYCVSKQQMDDVVKKINQTYSRNFSTERLHLDQALLGAEISTEPGGTNHGTMGARYGQWYIRMLK